MFHLVINRELRDKIAPHFVPQRKASTLETITVGGTPDDIGSCTILIVLPKEGAAEAILADFDRPAVRPRGAIH